MLTREEAHKRIFSIWADYAGCADIHVKDCEKWIELCQQVVDNSYNSGITIGRDQQLIQTTENN